MAIVRIVKMVFKQEEIASFQRMFMARRDIIRGFPGCRHLELWQEEEDAAIFFTYSIWENETALNHYRFSDFFKETWALTKSKFAGKPEAWTLNQVG
ncbi:MAG: antibiotic biosynthesis monooxygenase [Bacteroidetes bacterium]|nr:antibiotic biosynthesis monooxygenase [Bacteroidota bacterium]